ncbi:MAG: hypothetical protein J0I12_01550 [Candidatus Eremiobacteraeota bacterium]|nr:hypothetical protein [Candidatus Eremiobacteraeota bacterium]
MPTAQKMPQVLQDLLLTDASEIRRRTRCSLKEAREVQEALREGVWAVLQFPDLVAQLLGDPQPRYLRKFAAQRTELLRKVRRGQRLDVLRDLTEDGQLNQFQARDFMSGLALQGENWDRLEKLYSDPGDDFWEKRPQPKEAEGLNIELVFAPEQFDPQLLLEWLRKGHHREAVRWVRQLSGASRQDCQSLVDRLEEAVFDNHPDPWRLASRLYPGVVAPLAGLPSPDWLEILEKQRGELLDMLLNQRAGAAAQLVAESIPCTHIEARRFLRLLGDGDTWDRTLETFKLGQVFPKTKPKALPPKPRAAKPVAVVAPAPEPPAPVLEAAAAIVAAAAPEFTGAAPNSSGLSPWAAQREQERLAAEAAREQERQQAAQARQKEREESDLKRHNEMETSDRARHEEHERIVSSRQQEQKAVDDSRLLEATSPAAPQKLDLNDLDQVMDRLTRLGEAVQAKNTLEAMFILEELEQAGLNRDYVAARFPAMIPWLPDAPWSAQLDKIGVFAPFLGKLMKGEVDATELAKQWISGSGGEVDKIVGSLEKAWKTKSKADTEAALDLLKQNPHVAEEINRRVPWLSDLMDLDHDGTPDIVEAYEDPAAYFGDLMRTRFPELETRLGETRIQKIKEILPELLETMKERNMRGVMRVLSRLRLGPSDVKALLGALKHMHR